MPTVKRSRVLQKLKHLDDAVSDLRNAILESPVVGNTWNLYAMNPEEYVKEFVHVDPDELAKQLGAVRAMINEVSKLKSVREEKLHRD